MVVLVKILEPSINVSAQKDILVKIVGKAFFLHINMIKWTSAVHITFLEWEYF